MKALIHIQILCINSGIVSLVNFYSDIVTNLVNTNNLVWADHAHNISKAYSGTGALKTDFTRTGQRSYMGYVEDGANSVMRYLKNNFFDGPRQVECGHSLS